MLNLPKLKENNLGFCNGFLYPSLPLFFTYTSIISIQLDYYDFNLNQLKTIDP